MLFFVFKQTGDYAFWSVDFLHRVFGESIVKRLNSKVDKAQQLGVHVPFGVWINYPGNTSMRRELCGECGVMCHGIIYAYIVYVKAVILREVRSQFVGIVPPQACQGD